MNGAGTKRAARIRRHARVRKNVKGTAERPRLAVYRSLTHIYAQLIDDVSQTTIVAASDVEKDIRVNKAKKSEVAAMVGKLIAERAKQKKISQAIFDRGGYSFHGRIKALADAAREGGLEF